MKSIITRRGIAPSIHRWVYANGWHAASAFGLVACLAFPFSPLPSACLFFLAAGLAAIRVFVDFLEQLITAIEEDSEREERLSSWKVADGDPQEQYENDDEFLPLNFDYWTDEQWQKHSHQPDKEKH